MRTCTNVSQRAKIYEILGAFSFQTKTFAYTYIMGKSNFTYYWIRANTCEMCFFFVHMCTHEINAIINRGCGMLLLIKEIIVYVGIYHYHSWRVSTYACAHASVCLSMQCLHPSMSKRNEEVQAGSMQITSMYIAYHEHSMSKRKEAGAMQYIAYHVHDHVHSIS